MSEHYFAAIMAGGGGTRLWPLSRRSRPKQSLALFGQKTLFQIAVERIRPLIPLERVLVMTGDDQAELLKQQYPELPDGNFLIEPEPRGTAAAIGLAAVHIEARDPQGTMACLTADHYIKNEVQFRAILSAALEGAHQGGLFTLGITPTTPDPSYGYIHIGERFGEFAGCESFKVESFKEKPEPEVAKKYLESGEYLWNSGMFFWRTDVILSEMQRQLPDLHHGLMEIKTELRTNTGADVVRKVWSNFVNTTIDYGVMEAAQNVYVLPASDLGWVDVGDWGRLYEILASDDTQVVAPDSALIQASDGSLVLQAESVDKDRMIALLDVHDLVVIDTEDALLICKRQSAEGVKELIEKLKSSGREEYL